MTGVEAAAVEAERRARLDERRTVFDDEGLEGAAEEASARFRLRVSIQNRPSTENPATGNRDSDRLDYPKSIPN